jgi:hypothetical protein
VANAVACAVAHTIATRTGAEAEAEEGAPGGAPGGGALSEVTHSTTGLTTPPPGLTPTTGAGAMVVNGGSHNMLSTPVVSPETLCMIGTLCMMIGTLCMMIPICSSITMGCICVCISLLYYVQMGGEFTGDVQCAGGFHEDQYRGS